MRQLLISLNFPSFSDCKIIENVIKIERKMLRSVLGTGLLVTVYRAVLSVAAPEGETGERSPPPPEHIFFRAEKMRIDS